MSFKGDLSTIGLAEVFQMISMSQKQGTLIVQDADSRKCIYFGENGVELLSSGKRKGLKIGDMLVRAGKITDVTLSEALENAKIARKLVGEILVENGSVTQQDIQDVVRSQIEEEIYDLFLWKKANFEFVEGPPSDALRDPDAPVTKLAFDVNGLLLEAVRRADEWGLISQKIPSMDSIFVFVSESDRREEDKTAPDNLKRVYRLIDGHASVSELVENTGISRFDVCKSLLDLVERGRIRLLGVPEVMEVAVKRMGEGRRDKALKLYQAAAAQAPDDPKVVLAVAKILEGEDMVRDAAAHYAKGGRLFMNQGNLERSLECMEKAVGLFPDDPDIKLAMFEIHAAAGNLPEGKKLAGELVSAALTVPDYPRARMLCDRILAADPSDMHFRAQRAKVFHRTNLKKDLEEDLAFIRKNMPVDAGAAEKVLRELKDVLGSSPAISRKPSGIVKPKARGSKKKVAAALAFLLLLGGLGFAGKYELDARGELQGKVDEARRLTDEMKFAEARRVLQDFIDRYRYSLLHRPKAQDELAQLEIRQVTSIRELEDRLRKRAEGAAKQLRELEAKTEDERLRNPTLAHKHAQEFLKLAQKEKEADHKIKVEGLEEFLAKAQDVERTLREYLHKAETLRLEADKLEAAGKYREAAEAVERLIREYSTTETAKGATYPLAITSWPAGARVTLLGSNTALGETGEKPIVYRMREGNVVRLRFERPGYEPEVSAVPDKRVGELHVELLKKRELWTMPFGNTIGAEPAVGGDTLYVAVARNLYAVSMEEKKQLRWAQPVDGNIEGAPRVAGGQVYVVTNGRLLYAIDPAKTADHVAWKYNTVERPMAGPGAAPDGSAVYLVTEDRMLHAVNPKGEGLWKRELPSESRVEPVGISGGVIVACSDGWLQAVKGPNSPEDKLWELRLESGLGPMLLAGDTLYAGGVDSALYAVDVRRGVKLWRRPLPQLVTGRPARSGNTVIAAARDGKVYFLEAGSGEPAAAPAPFDARGAIHGGVAAPSSLFLFGSDDQMVYAYELAAGRLRWQFKGKGRIRVTPVVGGGRVFFASEDTLYAVELN